MNRDKYDAIHQRIILRDGNERIRENPNLFILNYKVVILLISFRQKLLY